jgi:addiction module RelE/StbE family toxin
MAYTIVWTANAKEDLQQIISYLKTNWSEAVAEQFVETVLHKVCLLENQPFIGIASTKEKTVRKLLISKHIALFYKVSEPNIILLDFFDVRQSEDKRIF